VSIAALQPLQLGLRHLQLAPEAVHLHMGCCQLLPCAPLNPQATSNRQPAIGTAVMNTKETERKERRKGKERKGKERKGKERKGKERKGKERKGKERLHLSESIVRSQVVHWAVQASMPKVTAVKWTAWGSFQKAAVRGHQVALVQVQAGGSVPSKSTNTSHVSCNTTILPICYAFAASGY